MCLKTNQLQKSTALWGDESPVDLIAWRRLEICSNITIRFFFRITSLSCVKFVSHFDPHVTLSLIISRFQTEIDISLKDRSLFFDQNLKNFFYYSHLPKLADFDPDDVSIVQLQGWDDVSFHGSRQIPTPHMDKLANDGVILNSYYVSPICTPTRSSIMTGKHPVNLG